MELLGERPVWSMSGSEMLSTLDTLDAELARFQTYRIQLIAGLEDIGYAKEIGAHDTARLLTFRHRLDTTEAHRDLRLARALPKYPTLSAALPTPAPPAVHSDTTPAPDPSAADPDTAPAPAPDPSADSPPAAAAGAPGSDATTRRPLRPAQAQAIVWALDRVAARVTPDNLAVAEEQLVGLAAHLSPAQLRKAGKEIGDLLDSDGPEPDELKAYARESLTLANADNGVKFRGFLANENAELFRSLIHAGARPHKTIDGDPDPRPREKRQADALTTALTITATTTESGHTPTTPTTTSTTPAPAATAATPTPAVTPSTPTTNSSSTARPTNAPPDARPTDAPSAARPTDAHSTIPPTDSRVTATPATSAAGARATDAFLTDPSAGAAGTPGTARNAGTTGWVPGFGAKANITVTIDFNDLKAATADATGQLVYGDALSAAAIRRLACDANIIPLVLGSNSEPLDVGRSERLVNRAMRRALNARDKGCVVCGAPPIHCDAHHIRSWIDGGPTSVDNLVLLCRRHHIDLHAGHWTITITNGTVHVARPTWAEPPPPTPHRPTPKRREDSDHPDAPARPQSGLHPPTNSPPTSNQPTAQPVNAPRGSTAEPLPAARRPAPEHPPTNSHLPADPADHDAAQPVNAQPVNAPPVSEAWPDDATGQSGPAVRRRPSKWQADDALLQEAARFAVWGDDSSRSTSEQSTETGSATPDDHTATPGATHPTDPACLPAEPTTQATPAPH
jgi:Domain of unknown function (DUF222)/HNH endonuclease